MRLLFKTDFKQKGLRLFLVKQGYQLASLLQISGEAGLQGMSGLKAQVLSAGAQSQSVVDVFSTCEL